MANRTQSAVQSFAAASHDAVIRVYDSAGESDHADDGLHPQAILSIENDKWVGHGKVTAHAKLESESIVSLVARTL
jgi:hypothetical protein